MGKARRKKYGSRLLQEDIVRRFMRGVAARIERRRLENGDDVEEIQRSTTIRERTEKENQ